MAGDALPHNENDRSAAVDRYPGHLTAHVQNTGDTTAEMGECIGQPGSGLWIEGFSLNPPDCIAPEHLEYRAVLEGGVLSNVHVAGRFCGSRTLELPLYGIAVALQGSAAERFSLDCEVTFTRGERLRISNEKAALLQSKAPLESIRLTLRDQSGNQARSTSEARRYVLASVESLTEVRPLRRLLDQPFSRAILASAGVMPMPPCKVLNWRPDQKLEWIGGQGSEALRRNEVPGRIFQDRIPYPAMWVARLDHAQLWWHAPPFFPAKRLLVQDYLIPWDLDAIGWFTQENPGVYRFPFNMKNAIWVETGFFMGHPLSWHFGHFIAECLCRMHAWHVCKSLFPEIKILLDPIRQGTSFHLAFLKAAGVHEDDVVIVERPTYCRTLLAASPALSVERYVSPSAAGLWRRICDGFGEHPSRHGKRIFLSRSGQPVRKLVNEADVENLFRGFGFEVVRPEALPLDKQVAMIGGAELIAGLGGSVMFSLAFQRQLRSAMWIVPDFFVQVTEWMFLAGTQCSAYYHIAYQDGESAAELKAVDRWIVDLADLESDIRAWLDEVL